MSPANLPRPAFPASGSSLNSEGHHTCTRCPVCATEECKVLEQLGMYCGTMCAASRVEAADRNARQNRRARRSAA
jgi:hypothetical protein